MIIKEIINVNLENNTMRVELNNGKIEEWSIPHDDSTKESLERCEAIKKYYEV